MSNARKRTTSGSSTATADNLPPPRKDKITKPVSAPLTNTRLHRLIYLLALLTALLAAFYSYRIVQYKSQVGGWWNLALRRHPSHVETSSNTPQVAKMGRKSRDHHTGGEQTVEDSINALARALGMPSKDLASAIAVAVREYVPPASLSSVAAKETGPVVKAMLEGGEYDHVKVQHQSTDSQASGVVGGVVSGMDSFVGMDEP